SQPKPRTILSAKASRSAKPTTLSASFSAKPRNKTKTGSSSRSPNCKNSPQNLVLTFQKVCPSTPRSPPKKFQVERRLIPFAPPFPTSKKECAASERRSDASSF